MSTVYEDSLNEEARSLLESLTVGLEAAVQIQRLEDQFKEWVKLTFEKKDGTLDYTECDTWINMAEAVLRGIEGSLNFKVSEEKVEGENEEENS